jgi:serpin B
LALSSCGKDLGSSANSEPLAINLSAGDETIANIGNSFTFDVLGRVIKESSGNIMISPYSLSACLSMTANGAAGATQDSMLNALGFTGKTISHVNSYFAKVTSSILKTDPSTKLSIANSIWFRNTISVKPEFIQTTTDSFKAIVKGIDFNASSSVNTINKWASDKTNGLITKVIEEITPDNIMFLLNAVYFKAIWAKGFEFDSKKSKEMLFYQTNKVNTTVNMMINEHSYNSIVNEKLSAVSIPYGNGAFEFMAFLPAESSSIEKMISDLKNESNFNSLTSQMESQNIILKIPKFKFKFDTRLNNILCSLGMGIAFDPFKADFSNAFNGLSDAHISYVKQFNYIEVNEKGTEAAAVTVTGIVATSIPVSPLSIVFNRPFVFIIREKATGIILFAGKIEDPNLTE